MLPVIPFPLPRLPVMPPLRLPVLSGMVSSVEMVASVEMGPFPSSMPEVVEGSVSMVVGIEVVSVGSVVTVGIVVGVVAGLELRQPQPASENRVRTSMAAIIKNFFICIPPF